MLLLFGCKKNAEKSLFLSDYFANVPALPLNGTPLDIEETDEAYFVQMWEMVYIDDMLIIRDKDLDHHFKVIDLNSTKMMKLGKTGEGPNELISDFTRASIDGTNRLVYISDYPHYYAYSLDSLKKENNIDPIRRIKISLQEDNLIESTLANGYVVGAMFRKRFGLHRLDDGHFSSLGEYGQGTFMSNQGVFYARPYDKKSVMLERSSESFAILDYADGNISLIKDFKGWASEQQEIEEPGGIVRTIPNENAKYCFVSGATSEKHIYALYSGNLRSTTGSIDPALANIVYVFDWSGNPVKKLTLDYPVRSIAVDEENQILYAGAFIGKDLRLIRFDME